MIVVEMKASQLPLLDRSKVTAYVLLRKRIALSSQGVDGYSREICELRVIENGTMDKQRTVCH